MTELQIDMLVKPLLDWYSSHARILPWRDEVSPYRIWVSEIMLQQTRVEAVKSYFDRFITELPDISSLANAQEEKLLKLWEGLGYYSRVRNLQKSAKIIMEQYSGQLPCQYDALLKLPGIGAYTAGAIASIAYGIKVPAVDGNVLRVIARITASQSNISDNATKKEFTQKIKNILPEGKVGDFNQALMELGATICIPNGLPLCHQCPVSFLCKAFQKDIVDQLPLKSVKKPRRLENRTVFLMIWDGKIALRKRSETGLLAGMWELPNVEGMLSAQKAIDQVENWGLSAKKIVRLKDAKHIFTHVEWHMTGYRIEISKMQTKEGEQGSDLKWITKEELSEQYALPSAYKQYRSEIN